MNMEQMQAAKAAMAEWLEAAGTDKEAEMTKKAYCRS